MSKMSVKIKRLSPNSGDLSDVVRAYLHSIGHHKQQIGKTPVFVRYENRRAVAVGPTRESVEKPNA